MNERTNETENVTMAETAETSKRRTFMKSLVTGAVAVGGLAAVSSVETASAATTGCSAPFTSDDLKQLTSTIQAYGGRLVEYFPCGIPAPDSLWGTASIRPEAAGALIHQLIRLDKFRFRLEAFPLGIPYPDLVNVRFRTPGAGGGL